jgi:zinc transporter 1/2/3
MVQNTLSPTYISNYQKKKKLSKKKKIKTFMQVVGNEEANNEHAEHIHVHTHATHGHAHGSATPSEGMNLPELTRHRIIAQGQATFKFILC